VSVVFQVNAAEPIRVFDPSGKVVETFIPKPGQSTCGLLIELMNVQYDAAPPDRCPTRSEFPAAYIPTPTSRRVPDAPAVLVVPGADP
jgi:hypothetical protein